MIALPDDRSRWARVPQDRRLRAGDLILRRIFHPVDGGGLVVAEVTAGDLPAAADQTVIVLPQTREPARSARRSRQVLPRTFSIRPWSRGDRAASAADGGPGGPHSPARRLPRPRAGLACPSSARYPRV